jgi:hypothetical protein
MKRILISFIVPAVTIYVGVAFARWEMPVDFGAADIGFRAIIAISYFFAAGMTYTYPGWEWRR